MKTMQTETKESYRCFTLKTRRTNVIIVRIKKKQEQLIYPPL